MEKLVRFLSGEVPGGFFLYFVVVLALWFIFWYFNKFSPVGNKEKLKKVLWSLTFFIAFSFTIVRIARPPLDEPVYIGILPLEHASSGEDFNAYRGLGWGVAEIACYAGELQSPPYFHFLRPEWLVESYDRDPIGQFSHSDSARVLSWASSIRLDYVTIGSFSIHQGSAELKVGLYRVSDHALIDNFIQTIPLFSPKSISTALCEYSTSITKRFLDAEGHKFNAQNTTDNIFQHASFLDYVNGRYFLSTGNDSLALIYFKQALHTDTTAVLALYGAGLAYSEKMKITRDDKARTNLQNRAEFYLKTAIHADSLFEPAYTALANFYAFCKPDPRYLEAEFAITAAYDMYNRDYMIYWLMSFMNKIRWEFFELKTKDEILKKALVMNPAAFDVYIKLGRNYLEFSRPNDQLSRLAVSNFLVAQKLRPNDLDAITGLATAYDHMSLHGDALLLLERGMTLYPTNSDMAYSAGVVHYHLAALADAHKKEQEKSDEFHKAETLFLKAVQLSNHGYAHLYLGKIYDLQKKREEAIAQFRAVMKILNREDPYREEARKKLREYFPDVE